jgi:transglutaminase-like putative cysteine protease
LKLHVLHRTKFLYRCPITDSHNRVRLRPATEDPERLPFFLLKVQPPRRLQHHRDSFFNYVHWFDIKEPHTELLIEAESHVFTTSQYADGSPTGVSFDQLKAGLNRDELHPFLGESRFVSNDQAPWRLAIEARDGRQDVFETAESIMSFIHAGWAYTPLATHAETHMRDVLTDRRGVCQDFAHLMLGLCRSQGIPARYVSGYLYNGPAGSLRGAQASHAWVEIWLPNHGWYGLDPTNNTLVDERYVRIATGRDYADAAPISGSFQGPPGAAAVMEVTVSVEEIKTQPSFTMARGR